MPKLTRALIALPIALAACGEPQEPEIEIDEQLPEQPEFRNSPAALQAFAVPMELRHKYNYVFATSQKWFGGNFGGLEGADAWCNDLADEAGLEGEYVAWLSTSEVDAIDRLQGAQGWIRVDGLPFVDSVKDLANGDILYPLRTDEYGQYAGNSFEHAITGTDGQGRLANPEDPKWNCYDWTVNGGIAVESGGLTVGGPAWTSSPYASRSCYSQNRIYCFGIDRETPLPEAKPIGTRKAFVSSPWTIGGGRKSADEQCQKDANDAGLKGSFKAFLALSDEAAIDRFDLEGRTWTRTDGVAIVAEAKDIATGNLIAAFDHTADGELWHDPWNPVFSGAERPWLVGSDEYGDLTCYDWTGDGEYPFRWKGGDSPKTNWWWFHQIGYVAFNCDFTHRLYCLEE